MWHQCYVQSFCSTLSNHWGPFNTLNVMLLRTKITPKSDAEFTINTLCKYETVTFTHFFPLQHCFLYYCHLKKEKKYVSLFTQTPSSAKIHTKVSLDQYMAWDVKDTWLNLSLRSACQRSSQWCPQNIMFCHKRFPGAVGVGYMLAPPILCDPLFLVV